MDPVTVAVTLGSTILGWFLATVWQWWLTKREDKRQQDIRAFENEKEHYYRALEKTEQLVDQCSEVSDLLYQFFKNCMQSVNAGQPLPPNAMEDFITGFQIRIGKVHVLERLYFPGIEFEAERITKGVDGLMQNVKEMIRINHARATGTTIAQSEYDRLNASNFQRLNEIVTEIAMQETMMQVSLRKTAERLKIMPQPVTVDRKNLKQPAPPKP